MRASAATCIPTKGYPIPFFDRKISGLELYIHIEFLQKVLALLDKFFYLGSKLLQVRVDGGIAIGMVYIHDLSIAVGTHLDTGDEAFSGSIYLKSLLAIGFDIQATMEVVRAQFAEIPCIGEGNIQGRTKIILGELPLWDYLLLGIQKRKRKKCNKKTQHNC